MYVQFSGSLSDTGVATNRIGTPTAAAVTLEDCINCGVAGWGWQDNGFGAGVLGPHIYFTGGAQTIRVQQREDGIAIDQIVLSPVTYLTTSPGQLKNDTTILTPSVITGTIVRHATAAMALHGSWRFVSDDTAADGTRIELPNAAVPKIGTALANPDNYFEVTFTAQANTPYRLWLRGRAQGDSVQQRFGPCPVFRQRHRGWHIGESHRHDTVDAGHSRRLHQLRCRRVGMGRQRLRRGHSRAPALLLGRPADDADPAA